MKAKITIVALIISLIPFLDVFSEEKTIQGEISLTSKYIGLEGEEGGKAKFTEYRDLRENGGFYGRARLNLDTDKCFLNFKASDFGYDTQHYKMDGGSWGKFKADLFYQEIPHNITFGARTFFLGAGSDLLVGPRNTNFPSWNTFDYSYVRRQLGGGLNLSLIKPFFLDASFQREEKEGIKPTGAAGTSPNGIAIELPEPVHYVTQDLKVEGGYAQKPLFLSLTYLYSRFNDSNTVLNFVNPATAAFDTFSLPPDNTYHKGSFKGAVKLPFNSRFSTNVGLSKGESDTSAFPVLTSPVQRGDFDGTVTTLNYDVVLTSTPVRFLDVKAYHKYYRRNNRSDEVAGIVEEFLDYKTMSYGGEVGLRLPLRFYVSGGYQYAKTEREFFKALTDPNLVLPSNRDRSYFGQVKWSGLDFLDILVSYERLDRDEFQAPVALSKMYAYAAQERDTFKTSIDIFPLENLNFGVEYRYKRSDYNGTAIGLKKDKRDEFGSNAAYTLGKIAKLYGNVDFGFIRFSPDLVRQEGVVDFPWTAKQRDRSFGYGFGTEVYVIPNKVTLVFQHDYLKSNGSVDFTIDPNLLTAGNGLAGANNDAVDIIHSEDYTLYSLKIKAIYNFTKFLAASLGYAYQRFNYRDDQLDGYRFVVANGVGSNGAFLTGAYKDQSYRANVVFGTLSYKF